MAEGIVFTEVDTIDENDLLDIITLRTAGDSTVTYVVYKESRQKVVRGSVTTLEADLVDIVPRQLEASLKVEFFLDNRQPTSLYIQSSYEGSSVATIDAEITEEAKQVLLGYFSPGIPVDEATLQKVKIPKGQQDFLSYAEIPEGTVMADFQNERDVYHRYYTLETFRTMIEPRMQSPYAMRQIQVADVSFYIAELDDSMTRFPIADAEGGRRGRRRKTLRERRRTPRNKRRST